MIFWSSSNFIFIFILAALSFAASMISLALASALDLTESSLCCISSLAFSSSTLSSSSSFFLSSSSSDSFSALRDSIIFWASVSLSFIILSISRSSILQHLQKYYKQNHDCHHRVTHHESYPHEPEPP